MDNQEPVPIGYVGVDTGRLLIIDPGYLESDELQTLLQQLDVRYSGLSDVPAKQVNYTLGHPGLGVVLTSGWGDGTYTVWADTFVDDDGFTKIREVRIRFL